MSKGNPEDVVYDYMKGQNRPYSTGDIFLNLQKKIGKTLLQKLIDKLVQENKLIEKVYGKQKIYVISQDEFPTVPSEDIKELARSLAEKRELLKTKKADFNEAKTKVSKLSKTPSTKELQFKIDKLKESINKKKILIEQAKIKANGMNANEIDKTVSRATVLAKAWKTRKRMCTQMMDQILESYPKPKKIFIEEADVTLDEPADTIPSY